MSMNVIFGAKISAIISFPPLSSAFPSNYPHLHCSRESAMVDPKLSSKKRKRPTLAHHPLLGIFTRSKSHLHRHRSFSDSKKPRSTPHSSPLLVKDLRSRRIFSDGFGLVSSRDQNDAVLDSQTTPPDIVNTNKYKDSISNGEGFSANTDQRNGTNHGIKPVLGPRSRMKLFKAPGSFSYRRLLPYLMDVSKDYSCASELDKSPKIKKGLEEKRVLTCLGQEILINKCKTESNTVGDVIELNVESIECIKESSSQEELCVRREFSVASVVNVARETFDLKSCIKDHNLNDSKTDLCLNCNVSVSDSSGDAKSIDSGEACTFDVKGYSKDSDLCHTKSDMSDKMPNDGLSNSDNRGEGDHCEVIDHNEQSNVLMTPPDADIFYKPEVAESGGNSVKSTLSTADNDFWRSMDVSINRSNSCLEEKSIDSSPTRKWDLGQRSRLKLFKVPGSMSYRRMLPFLIDVTKNNSCGFGKDHRLKLEKCSEEKTTLPSTVSDNQETPIESSNFHTKPDVVDCCATSNTISTSSLNDQESNQSYEHSNESPKPCTSLQEKEVHFEQEMSDTERKLGTGPQMFCINDGSNPPASSSPSLLGPHSLSKDNAKFVSNELSVYTGEDCTQSVIEGTNGEKQIEIDSLHRESSYLEASFHLDVPSTALKKGILKRTPRGCRGLCSCLNCSSFRLNAERAFEFSSNQMQDAEEVALDLIRELSHMRNMLEKSALGADGRAVVCISQVKEACKRASEAEELAQTRLSQMNFDLRVHSKMTCAQRPRVRFANRVEEQVITYSDLPSK